ILHIKEGSHYEIADVSVLPYQHIAILGHGGSAVVEKVKDSVTNSVYARKVYKMLTGGRYQVKEAYHREIQTIRRLSPHPHIIRVFATYRTGRTLAVILHPVADGGDLASFLSHYRDLGDGDLVAQQSMKIILNRAFGCLAKGLAFMHQKTIRHKDIKPHNILIHQGSVVYTDFGLAKDYSNGSSTSEGHPGQFSRRYCSPEVADHGIRNRKSDIFSLGCVFLEMFATLFPGEIPNR
ncbi:kinase-like protein, partial [Zopfia rhizophila CBS 207.26]